MHFLLFSRVFDVYIKKFSQVRLARKGIGIKVFLFDSTRLNGQKIIKKLICLKLTAI